MDPRLSMFRVHKTYCFPRSQSISVNYHMVATKCALTITISLQIPCTVSFATITNAVILSLQSLKPGDYRRVFPLDKSLRLVLGSTLRKQVGNLSALTQNSRLISSQSFIFAWKSKNANFCSIFSFFTLKYD